jgi:hypothetical protein
VLFASFPLSARFIFFKRSLVMTSLLLTLYREWPDVWGQVSANLTEADLFLLSITCQEMKKNPLDLEGIGRVLVGAMATKPLYLWLLRIYFRVELLGGNEIWSWLFEQCYSLGYLEILQLWGKLAMQWPHIDRILSIAAEKGYESVLMWVNDGAGKFSNSIAFLLAKYGHLKLLKTLHYRGLLPDLYSLDEHIAYGAAQGGHLNIIKWIREEVIPLPEVGMLDALVKGCDDLALFKWLIDHHEAEITYKGALFHSLVSYGRLSILKFAIEKWGFPNGLLGHAIAWNQPKVLIFLLEELKIPIDDPSFLALLAIQQGNVSTLRYLINTNRITLGEGAMNAALRSRKVAMIEYLFNEGYAIPPTIFVYEHWDQDLIIWFIEHGFPFVQVAAFHIIERTHYLFHKNRFREAIFHRFPISESPIEEHGSIRGEMMKIIKRQSKLDLERGSIVIEII